MFLFKKIIFCVSFCVFLLILTLSSNLIYFSIIPLFWGCAYFFIAPKSAFSAPGVIIMNIIQIFRYLIIPTLYAFCGCSFIKNSNNSVLIITIILYLLECLTINLTWRFSASKYSKKSGIRVANFVSQNNNFIFYIFVLLTIGVLIFSPSAFNRYHFIINSNESMFLNDEKFLAGAPRILEYAKIVLSIFLFEFFLKKYSIGHKKKYFYLCLISVIFISLFYTDMSRNSLVLPLLVSWSILIKYFYSKKKLINRMFLLLSFFSIMTLSMMKFFGSKDISNAQSYTQDSEWIVSVFDGYFGAFKNTYIGVQYKDLISPQINSSTLINDIFKDLFFVRSFLDPSRTSASEYVKYAGGGGVIMPSIIHGYLYFGLLFSVIFTVMMTWLLCYFDFLYAKSTSIWITYLSSLFALRLGWYLQGNFIINISYFFTALLPVFIIYALFQQLKKIYLYI